MKQNINKIAIALIILLIGSKITVAQSSNNQKEDTDKQEIVNKNYKIESICRNYGDSIVIRWAPNAPTLWLLSNNVGYMVERVVKVNGKTEFIPVRSEAFKPLSKEAMIERYKDEKHPYGMVAAQFLYGEVDLSDGETGLAATVINKTEEQNMRYGYSLQAADFDPDVADALGLRYVFYPKQSNDTVFTFRVRSLLTNEKVEAGWCGVKKDNVFKNNLTPYGVQAKPLKNGARLFWMRNNNFSAYYIERSVDNKNFTQLNSKPFLTSHMKEEEVKDARISKIDLPKDSLGNSYSPNYMQAINLFEIYQDDLPNNNEIFYYRIRGLDAFGQVSPPSKTVAVKGIPPLEVDAPSDVKVTKNANGGLLVTWKNGKKTEGLKGLIVSTSNSIKGQRRVLHKGLLPLGTTSIVDNKVEKGAFNLYFVAAVDTMGNYYSAQPSQGYIPDTTPPAIPKNVTAAFDATGMSLITWDKNTEEDLKGYKVYQKFNENGTWMQITELPVEDPFLFDVVPLETLTRNTYYCVVAVDKSGNHSKYSVPVKVELPDIVPPTAPVIDSYKLTNEKVSIDFIASSSNDVAKYDFCRKKENGNWILLKSIKAEDVKDGKIFVEDSTIETSVNYSYAMRTVDKSGLSSEFSSELPILLRNRGLQYADFNLNVKQKNANNLPMAIISWNKMTVNNNDFHYVIYKKKNNEFWRILNSFGNDEIKAVDKNVSAGNTYMYKIAIFINGGKKSISKIVSIKIK